MRTSITTLVDGSPGRSAALVASIAVALEELGFHGLRVPDHVLVNGATESRYPYSESGRSPLRDRQGFLAPHLVLQVAGVATTTLRLGTAVEIVALRNPVQRAQEVATLDVLTGGRVDWGVGVGWQREEFDACGIDFASRGRRADELLAAVNAVWSSESASFDGEFFRFDGINALPKPVQQPRVPIIVGGTSPAALRRAARHGDGWFAWAVDDLDQLDVMLADLRPLLEHRPDGGEGFRIWVGREHPVAQIDDLASYADGLRDRGVDELVVGVALSRSGHREQRRVAEVLIRPDDREGAAA